MRRRTNKPARGEDGAIRAKLAVGVATVLAMGGIGTGVAFAAGSTGGPAVTVNHTTAAPDAPEGTAPAAESDGPGGHQDPPGANVGSTAGGPDVATSAGAEKAGAEADTGPDSGPGGGGNTQSGSQAGGPDVGGNN